MNEEKYCTVKNPKPGVDGHVWGIPDSDKFITCRYCGQMRDGGYLNPDSPRVIEKMEQGFAINFICIHATKDKVIKEVHDTLERIPNIGIVLVVKQFEPGHPYWVPDWTTFTVY